MAFRNNTYYDPNVSSLITSYINRSLHEFLIVMNHTNMDLELLRFEEDDEGYNFYVKGDWTEDALQEFNDLLENQVGEERSHFDNRSGQAEFTDRMRGWVEFFVYK